MSDDLFNEYMNDAFRIITSSAHPETAVGSLAMAQSVVGQTSNPRANRAQIGAYQRMMDKNAQSKQYQQQTRDIYEREWLTEDARRGR